jgi:hypothetical protein
MSRVEPNEDAARVGELERNRAGALSSSQHRMAAALLEALRYDQNLCSKLAADLDEGRVTALSGEVRLRASNVGRGGWVCEWRITTEAGVDEKLMYSLERPPLAGPGTRYVLPRSLTYIGEEPPTAAQLEAERATLLSLQDLTVAQADALGQGTMPAGIKRSPAEKLLLSLIAGFFGVLALGWLAVTAAGDLVAAWRPDIALALVMGALIVFSAALYVLHRPWKPGRAVQRHVGAIQVGHNEANVILGQARLSIAGRSWAVRAMPLITALKPTLEYEVFADQQTGRFLAILPLPRAGSITSPR